MKCPVVFLFASCTALMASVPPEVDFELFGQGYNSPTFMIPYQSGERAFLVGEQSGTISFLPDKGGARGETFLDINSRLDFIREGFDERGLLGLALHPDFKTNRKFYLYYCSKADADAPNGFDHTVRLSEFTTTPDGSRADLESERVVLSIHEPQWNHNSGNLLFGPDGFLYVTVGDGGAANDLARGHAEGGNGQSTDTLLGKILRIDVNADDGYLVPLDNPLVGKPGRDEIFAWGIRNPWGIFVDHEEGGRIIFADVGQNRFEEVNILRRGANYGWPRYEGFAPFDQKNPSEVITIEDSFAADLEGTEPPVLAYPHPGAYGDFPAQGISITGGPIYRGADLEGLQGWYLCADWGMSWAGPKFGLFAARPGPERWPVQVLPGSSSPDDSNAWITAFAEDRNKEVYILTNNSNGLRGVEGKIWKLVPAE